MKVTGPMMSIDANGRFTEHLTFAKLGKTNYVKRGSTPIDRRSPPQVSVRVAMTFLAKQWPLIDARDQATWEDLAAADRLTTNNVYTRINQRRNHADQTPSQTFPVSELLIPTDAFLMTAMGKPRHIFLTLLTPGAHANNWGFISHLGPFPNYRPSFDNVIDLHPIEPGLRTTWTIPHIEAGNYLLKVQAFSIDGTLSSTVKEGLVSVE